MIDASFIGKIKQLLNSKKISSRDKKVLLAGGVGVAAILIYIFILDPLWQTHLSIQNRIQAKKKMIESSLSVIRKKGGAEKRLAQLNKEESKWKKRLLKGTSPSLAAAELQDIVNSLAFQKGITITSIRVKPAETINGWQKIPLQARAKGDIKAVQDFIYQLETHSRYLVITRLEMNKRIRASSSVSKKGREINLDMIIASFIPQPKDN